MCISQPAVPVADVSAYCCLSAALNACYSSTGGASQFLNLLAELLVCCHLFVSVKMGAKLTETSYWNCFSRWFFFFPPCPWSGMGGTQPGLWKTGAFRRVKKLLDLEDFPLENQLQGTEMHLDNAFPSTKLKFWLKTSVFEDWMCCVFCSGHWLWSSHQCVVHQCIVNVRRRRWYLNTSPEGFLPNT